MRMRKCYIESCFFFNDTATTEIYTLSLHDALPIFGRPGTDGSRVRELAAAEQCERLEREGRSEHHAGWFALRFRDRKSTRLNSSHANISYAVFCLKKKKKSADTHTLHCRLFITALP